MSLLKYTFLEVFAAACSVGTFSYVIGMVVLKVVR